MCNQGPPMHIIFMSKTHPFMWISNVISLIQPLSTSPLYVNQQLHQQWCKRSIVKWTMDTGKLLYLGLLVRRKAENQKLRNQKAMIIPNLLLGLRKKCLEWRNMKPLKPWNWKGSNLIMNFKGFCSKWVIVSKVTSNFKGM